MSPLFFYGRDGAQYGPFSAAQMRSLAVAGGILQTDSVWRQGEAQRTLASRVGNLFPPPVSSDPAPAPLAAAEPAEAPALAVQEVPRSEPRRPSQADKDAARKKRVIAIKGGVLMSQDGVSVQFRKKCDVCKGEDSSRSTAVIRQGTTRISYFCRKCRKARTVELQGII